MDLGLPLYMYAMLLAALAKAAASCCWYSVPEVLWKMNVMIVNCVPNT